VYNLVARIPEYVSPSARNESWVEIKVQSELANRGKGFANFGKSMMAGYLQW